MTQFDSTSITGENFPAWLAFVLSLLGIAGCIFTVQTLVPDSLESKVFVPHIVEFNKERGVNSPNLSDIQIVQKTDKPIKVESLVPETIEKKQSPEILTTYDCPPLFTFAFEKNNKAPSSLKLPQQLVELKEWLDIHPDATIILEGYSSSKGPSESNLLLSYRRSNAVKKILMKSGVLEQQISTLAFGEEIPLLGEPSTSIKNQRVSMRLDGTINCNNHSDN